MRPPAICGRALATRPLKDAYGNEYLCVDEDMRLRLETKLSRGIMTGFKVLPAQTVGSMFSLFSYAKSL